MCPLHIEYLDELDEKGKDFESGPFHGSGYFTETLEEAHSLAENDPHVDHNVDKKIGQFNNEWLKEIV
ncbi:hypothetical protein EI200_12160 [Peribacillus simplex]|uniref:hypothetical protein n=1 Tax=Peribacillus simplex TaxID=1478 RepID=UPI000F641107|nr:hypothetical protein [Peribacillus simplex]RRN71197.1 hypothetical protein EI200_12160 [Peribacillus simplex]